MSLPATGSPAPQAQEAVPRSVVQDESLCMRWDLITELGAVELVRSMSEAWDNESPGVLRAPFCSVSLQPFRYKLYHPIPFHSQSVGSKRLFNRGVKQAHAGVT